MSKDKEIRRSFLRYSIVLTVLMILFLFVKKDNIIIWVQSARTIKKQEIEMEQLRQDIARIDQHLQTLANNRDSLEKFAREKYNFAQSGEDVYIIE